MVRDSQVVGSVVSGSTAGDELVVFGHEYCAHAVTLASALERHEVEYKWIDILGSDKTHKEELRTLTGGTLSVPTVRFPDHTVMVEPAVSTVLERLGIRSPGYLSRIFRRIRTKWKVLALVVLLLAMVPHTTVWAQAEGVPEAVAQLVDLQGNVVGTATFASTTQGLVRLHVELRGFTAAQPGEHGIHIYERSQCAPTFEAAGEIFNPTRAQHGLNNPAGPQAGDLPNIVVFSSGNADYTVVTSRISLGPGERSILDQDGSALVIRERRDDQISQPAGDSGARIACGAITAVGAVPAVVSALPSPAVPTPTALSPITPTPFPPVQLPEVGTTGPPALYWILLGALFFVLGRFFRTSKQ